MVKQHVDYWMLLECQYGSSASVLRPSGRLHLHCCQPLLERKTHIMHNSHHWLQLDTDVRVCYDITDTCHITFHHDTEGIIGEIYCSIADARKHYKEMLTEGATV